ncbi:hypothetical protein [Actinomadura hibisca]|uniref:hypothetical protein n=1 Tax=Actinomadura hibisca TaxID=68565 RepID=UPI000A017D24|nr:hypothetical protein [Actinomadura hibisca]
MAVRRSLYVTISTAAVAGLLALPVGPLLLRDRLPGRLASHWGTGGTPDQSLPFAGMMAVIGLVWLLFCGAALALGHLGWQRRYIRAWTGATLGTGAALCAAVVAITLRLNLDRDTWREAGNVDAGVLVPLLLGMVAGGVVGWLVGNVGPDRVPAAPVRDLPRLDLAERDRPTWFGSVHSRWAVWLGGALAAAGVLGAVAAWLLPASLTPGRTLALAFLPLVVAGLAGLTLSSARVTAGDTGLAVAFGPLGRPVKRIALDRVESAWTERRTPAQVGGWGYRLSGLGTTAMLRSGECLVIAYDGDKRFAVSVDDSERAAALLNSLRERAAA